MLLFADLVVIGLVASMLSIAIRRGRTRAARNRARRAVPGGVDLIPGRPVPTGAASVVRSPARPVATSPVAAGPSTWSASRERGETAPTPAPVPIEAPAPAPVARPASEPVTVPSAVPATAGGIHADRKANGSANGSGNGTAPRPLPASTRPGVVVAPRGRSWIVRREGAARASSIHSSREAAEARGRKTARRERVVLEVRDADEHVLDRADFRTAARAIAGSDA